MRDLRSLALRFDDVGQALSVASREASTQLFLRLPLGNVQLLGDEVNRRTDVEVIVKIVEVRNKIRIAWDSNALIKTELYAGKEGETSCEDAEEQRNDTDLRLLS